MTDRSDRSPTEGSTQAPSSAPAPATVRTTTASYRAGVADITARAADAASAAANR